MDSFVIQVNRLVDSQARILNGLPFPTPGDLPNPGIKPASPASLLYIKQIAYCWATGEAWILKLPDMRLTYIYVIYIALYIIFSYVV